MCRAKCPTRSQVEPPTMGNKKCWNWRGHTTHSRICSHMYLCQDVQLQCAQRLSRLTGACPMCRHPVAQVTTISAQYQASESAGSKTCYIYIQEPGTILG